MHDGLRSSFGDLTTFLLWIFLGWYWYVNLVSLVYIIPRDFTFSNNKVGLGFMNRFFLHLSLFSYETLLFFLTYSWLIDNLSSFGTSAAVCVDLRLSMNRDTAFCCNVADEFVYFSFFLMSPGPADPLLEIYFFCAMLPCYGVLLVDFETGIAAKWLVSTKEFVLTFCLLAFVAFPVFLLRPSCSGCLLEFWTPGASLNGNANLVLFFVETLGCDALGSLTVIARLY